MSAAQEAWLDAQVRQREEASAKFFGAEADRIAGLCHRLAERFARGGRLLALASSPAALSDARHVAVEFVHPVIGGKRALPALALAPEGGSLAAQTALLAAPDDVVLALAHAEADASADLRAAVGRARERGCLTVATASLAAEWELVPPGPDPCVRQELAEALYHLLWELVYVFLDHRGLLEGRSAGPLHDAGPSSFLYPFLAESDRDLEGVRADVRASVEMKAADSSRLRSRILTEERPALLAAARALRTTFDGGGTVLAIGNGGSASDAMDWVADLRDPPAGADGRARWPARPALDLTADPAVITAIANDVGAGEVFARQVAAYGRKGDALVAFSTSGGSPNVVAALAEARRRGLRTVALLGYDGGRIAREGLADHAVVSRSEHVPRIQEAQASACHVLRELLERVPPEAPT